MTTVSDPHLILVRPVTPRTPQGCEECLRRGTPWVYAIGHPIGKSSEPGEDWRWCYVDESYL